MSVHSSRARARHVCPILPLLLLAACAGPVSDGATASGTTTTSDSTGTTGEPEGAGLQADVESVVPLDAHGGVVALVLRDGVESTAAAGTANADGDPLSVDMPFNIASVTKTYTATLIFQLQEQGLLDVTDALSVYLPQTSYGPDVTLDTLLNHRSGIPDYASSPAYFADVISDPDRVFTPWELVGYADFEPAAPAGEAYAYSNTGFTLLGLVIEEVTGAPLSEALQAGIVEPLGLSSTELIDPTSFPSDMPSAWLDPTSFGFPPDTALPVMPVPALFSGCQADCGIVTTAADLRRFYEGLFDGSLVSEQSLAQMTSAEADAASEGRGLEIFEGEGTPAYGHGGGGTGYTAVVVIEPESGDVTVVFATNDAFDLQPLLDQYLP